MKKPPVFLVAALLLTGASLTAEEPAPATLHLYDGFDGAFSLDWKPVRHEPGHVSLEKHPGQLTITTQRGALHGDVANSADSEGIFARNLFVIDNPLADADGFVITTCVDSFRPSMPWQQAGLLVYDDDANYVKFTIEAMLWNRDAAVLPRVLSFLREREMHAHYAHLWAPLDGNRIWLRLTRRGAHYELACSADGEVFLPIIEYTWTGEARQVGLLAKNGGDPRAHEIDARFDSFELRALTEQERQQPRFALRRLLEGDWIAEEAVLGGTVLDGVPLTQVSFTDTTMTLAEAEGESMAGTYAQGPADDHDILYVTFPPNSHRLAMRYAVDADRLRLAFDSEEPVPAPPALESAAGDTHVAIALRRADP